MGKKNRPERNRAYGNTSRTGGRNLSAASPRMPNPVADATPIGSANWSVLRARLFRNRDLAFLRQISEHEAFATVLMPAVTLAMWIRSFMPELAERKNVHVVVAGAELLDGLQQGIWYQLVPYLLDSPSMKLQVTLLYENAKAHHASPAGFDALRDGAASFDLADEVTTSLGTWLGSQSVSPDLIMLFHPGFEYAIDHDGVRPYSWLDQGELASAIDRGIPIGLTAYEQSEFEQERWLLRSYGIVAEARTVQSPFITEPSPHQFEAPPAGWGSFLWKIDPASTFAVPPADHPVLLANQKATQQLRAAASGEFPIDLWNLGRIKAMKTPATRSRKDVIILANGLAIDPQGGEVMATMKDELWKVQPLLNVAPDLLARYPQAPAFPYELTVWGAEALHQATRLIEDNLGEFAIVDPSNGNAVQMGEEQKAA